MPVIPAAFIFPAFASDYTDHPGAALGGFAFHFERLLDLASGAIDPGLSAFRFSGPDFLDDELRTQYLTYLYSCAASQALRETKLTPCFSAGYSMGIYAALFDAGVIRFEDGLRLITYAYRALRETLVSGAYGMASIIGLDGDDITGIAGRDSLRVTITNRNAAHSYVVSGFQPDIALFVEKAREEGALHTRDLGVSVPYHSPMLEQGARVFATLAEGIPFRDAANPVVSLIDQAELSNADAFRNEVIRNLHTPLNWMETQLAMTQAGVSLFIECGPSRGLVKNARFIEGPARFSALDKLGPAY